MIYIVTGDGPRCGSSMMMLAMAHGGLKIAFSEESQNLAQKQADEGYHPNPTGRFELKHDYIWDPGFPDPEAFDGTCIKLFPEPWGGLLRMVAGEYRLCWMHRPAKARWKSFHKAHAKDPLNWQKWPTKDQKKFMQYRDLRSAEVLHIMRLRKDVHSITELDFDDVLENPEMGLWMLKHEGWPIDPKKARAAVNPKLKHF